MLSSRLTRVNLRRPARDSWTSVRPPVAEWRPPACPPPARTGQLRGVARSLGEKGSFRAGAIYALFGSAGASPSRKHGTLRGGARRGSRREYVSRVPCGAFPGSACLYVAPASVLMWLPGCRATAHWLLAAVQLRLICRPGCQYLSAPKQAGLLVGCPAARGLSSVADAIMSQRSSVNGQRLRASEGCFGRHPRNEVRVPVGG